MMGVNLSSSDQDLETFPPETLPTFKTPLLRSEVKGQGSSSRLTPGGGGSGSL